ncbi:MAG: hypothetical protein IJI67_01600 [Clostridia bacterium]|nr:hypothetical protein [Clostridia bacterium]
MKKHIIIEKSKKYVLTNQELVPAGCSYNSKGGFWVDDSSNIAMMRSLNFELAATKKCDIETGEDQKGE